MKTHCKICGKEFKPDPTGVRRGGGKYCSQKCYHKSHVTCAIRKCVICGDEFKALKHDMEKGFGKCCSQKCNGIARTTRVECQCEICGEVFTEHLCHLARGQGKYCSGKCRGIAHRGSDYAPEKRRGSETYLWRKEVFTRDKFKCQDCGDKRGGNLNAHHLFSWRDFPEVRYEVWNGMTLCEDCHKARHYAAVA